MASISLITLYLLFQHLQVALVLYVIFVSFCAVAFSAAPMLARLLRRTSRLRRGLRPPTCCDGMVLLDQNFMAPLLAVVVVLGWLLTGHWMFTDLIGVSLCITIISVLRLSSLKVATICLVSLFVYDIFWVFFSERIFGQNVMVEVAQKAASNPVRAVGRNLNLPFLKAAVRNLQLPFKLMFPNLVSPGFSILGLGDIALPGVFLAFILRFDHFLADLDQQNRLPGSRGSSSTRSGQVTPPALTVGGHNAGAGSSTPPDSLLEPLVPPQGVVDLKAFDMEDNESSVVTALDKEMGRFIPENCNVPENQDTLRLLKISEAGYFNGCLRGYVIGLIVTVAICFIFKAAQPALLYLVPGVLIPAFMRGRKLGHTELLWNGFEAEADGEEGTELEERELRMHSL